MIASKSIAESVTNNGWDALMVGQLAVTQWLRQVGSIPTSSTMFGLKVFMDAHEPVTLEEGDRYPLGPPSICPVS
jgi:acyl CoA:acetate/3-ketoacid CoA transferase